MKPSGRIYLEIFRDLYKDMRGFKSKNLGGSLSSSSLNSFRQRRDSVGSCFLLLHAFIGRCSKSGIGSCVEILTGPSIRYIYVERGYYVLYLPQHEAQPLPPAPLPVVRKQAILYRLRT
jgi:hypothetical protein